MIINNKGMTSLANISPGDVIRVIGNLLSILLFIFRVVAWLS